MFFLASSFDRAMKKLEQGLQFLQKNEEKLWFWGVDRAEDLGFTAEFLKEVGLQIDRRTEFPRKAASLSLEPEREAPASALGPDSPRFGGIGRHDASRRDRRLTPG